MIQFYDAADIARIPEGVSHAALYHDGLYAVSGAQARRFPYRRWITITGDGHSGIADFEPGNPIFERPGALRGWVADRHSLDLGTPIVYSDRANIAEALRRTEGMRVLWWITTLDGRDWTAAELAAELAARFGAHVLEADIWGNQNLSQDGYDRSNLFLGWWA